MAAPGASDRWIQRPDVWSGLVLGNALVGRSFQPSLMPRKTGHQAIVSGASGAIGFGVAQAAYGLVARTGTTRGDLALLAATSAGGFALSRVLPEQDGEAHWRPLVRTAGSAAAAGGLAAALGVVVRAQPPHRRGYVGGALALGGALSGARAVGMGIAAQRKAHTEYDPPPPKPLPAVGVSVGVATVLTAVVTGFRRSSRKFAQTLERRLGVPPAPSRWLGRGLTVGVWFGAGKTLADTFVSGLRVYDRVVDAGFDRAPVSPYRSSGLGSAVPFARLGREGRRFVLNAPDVAEIEAVMGCPARAEPIRVFVGYAAARSDDDRVALAVDELRRTGAFDRRLLVVGSAAGNGYVNTLPLEVLDHVLLGDTAAVSVQYGRLPSVLTLRRVTRGGQVQRRLLEAIAAEVADRPADRRPTVVVYGESLGAWSGQDTFLHRGIDGLDELGVARALWAGTPYYSGWKREVLVDRSVEVPPGSVLGIDGPAALEAIDDDARRALRAVVLDHGNDPVCYLGAALLVRRPPWLARTGPRPWGVPEKMAFLPGITAIQVIVDALNAMRPVPGVFRATGHEYTADLPDVVLDAYDIERPAPEVWQALVAHLRQRDADRAGARHPRRSDDG